MENIIIGVISSVIGAIIIAFVSRTYRKIRTEQNMITSVKLETTPFFKNDSTINLNKINFIYGDNATGKTAFADWISTLENDDRISRWELEENCFPIVFTTKLRNSKIDYVRININSNGVTYYSNNHKSVVSPISYKFVFIENINLSAETAIEFISKQLSIKQTQLIKLIDEYGSQPILSVDGIKTQNDLVLIKLHNKRNWDSFSVLSSSEKQRIVIELGVLLCIAYSKANNIVLVVEESSFCLNKRYFKMLMDRLSKNHYKFQIIFLSVYEPYFDLNNKINAFVLTNKIPDVEIIPV